MLKQNPSQVLPKKLLKGATVHFYCLFDESRFWDICRIMELILSWRRPLSYRNQSFDLRSKSMDWFLYDKGLRHERANWLCKHMKKVRSSQPCISINFCKVQVLPCEYRSLPLGQLSSNNFIINSFIVNKIWALKKTEKKNINSFHCLTHF